MKFELDYSNAGIDSSHLNEAFQKLKPEIVRALL